MNSAQAIGETATRLRILVAEDDELNALYVDRLLVRRGHDVLLARDGHRALATAAAEDVDLILIDVCMPGLDGFDVVRAIRAREQETGGHVPVIALTARAGSKDRERCLAAGMDEFLTKPIGARDLVAAVERMARSE